MRYLAFLLWLMPVTAWALNTQRLVVLQHPPVPSYTADFRAGTIPPNIGETRGTTAWDYSTTVDGVTTPIVAFGTTTPRWPTWTQRTPIFNLGLGAWTSKSNNWRDSSQTQTRAITNGATYNIWCDSANGTDSVAFTGGLVGTVTANGWPGALTATATTTSTTGTVTGTVTGCTMITAAAVFPPPPIITTTGAVGVNADVPTLPIASLTGYSQSGGTMVVTFYPTTSASGGTIFSLDDNTANNRITATVATSTKVSMAIVVGGSAAGTGGVTANAGTNLQFNRVAYSWGGQMFCYSLNGGPVLSAATTGLPTVTQLGFGHRAGTIQLNGYIQKDVYYPQRLCHKVQLLSSSLSSLPP